MPSLYPEYDPNNQPADPVDSGSASFITPPQAILGQQAEIKLALDVNQVQLTNVKVTLVQRGIQADTQTGSTDPAPQPADSSQRVPLGFEFVDVRAEVDTVVEYKLQFTPNTAGLQLSTYRIEADQLAQAVTGNATIDFVQAAGG